jgi:hypothetical protein
MTEYGIDYSTFPDLDPAFREVTGPRAVAEAVARYLLMPPGTLPYDPAAGFDLRGELSGGIDDGARMRIRAGVARQALRDERVEDVSVSVDLSGDGQKVRVRVAGTTAEGPFTLTVAASGLDVAVLIGGES